MSRPLIMGVLNITPDSFSDGGLFNSVSQALVQAKILVAEGADIIDVGGESTRPGASRVSVEVELERVLPVIEAIMGLGARISVDTMNSETAAAAVAAGATIINDVSGGQNDPEIFSVAQRTDATLVISHWRGYGQHTDGQNNYFAIGKEVASDLAKQVALAKSVGVSDIVIDPGLGFAKDVEQNWKLLEELHELEKLELPILLGASRKRFIAARLMGDDTTAARDEATAELMSTLSKKHHLWAIRVHNVRATLARQN